MDRAAPEQQQVRRWSFTEPGSASFASYGRATPPPPPPPPSQQQQQQQQTHVIDPPVAVRVPLLAHATALHEVRAALSSSAASSVSPSPSPSPSLVPSSPLMLMLPPPMPLATAGSRSSCPMLPHISDILAQQQEEQRETDEASVSLAALALNEAARQPHTPSVRYTSAMQHQRRQSRSRSRSRSPSPGPPRDDFATANAAAAAAAAAVPLPPTATQRSPSPKPAGGRGMPKNLKWHQYVPAERPRGVRNYPLAMV